MWIRLGMISVLSFRKLGGIGFGFIPNRREWTIGVAHFAILAPVAIVAGMLLGFARPHAASPDWAKTTVLAVGTFAGVLWVLALGEEFFFRGMLQQLLAKHFRSPIAGLAAASVAFGLVHLPFRQFPNWKFAVLATLAGLFYGSAYLRAGGIRASMVTHALVVTMWRVFFA